MIGFSRNRCGGVIYIVAIYLALISIGCGKSDRPKTIPVRGVITFGGGTWPRPGKIFFTCIEPEDGYPLRPGFAEFNEQGEFTAGSFEEDDGLVPGTFQMAVECWEVPPNFDGRPSKSVVPEKYYNPSTAGLEEIVIKSSDSHRELVIDISKHEPQ